MITMLEYDKMEMSMEEVNSTFISLLNQSDVKFIKFDITDSESVDNVNTFYQNIDNINTDVFILLRVSDDIKNINLYLNSKMIEEFKKCIENLDSNGCNVIIIKDYTVMTRLKTISDFILSFITIDDSYIINITKSLVDLENAFCINFKLDKDGLVYFHELFLDSMNNLQKIVFKKQLTMYFNDFNNRNFYLVTPKDIEFSVKDINVDDLIENISEQLNHEFTDEYKQQIKDILSSKVDNCYDMNDIIETSSITEDIYNNIGDIYKQDWLNSKDKYMNNKKIQKPAPQPKKLRIFIDGEEV